MDMVVKIGNVTEKHTFTLIPGQTVSWNHFKVSLVSTSLPTVPYLNTKFITDYRRIAVAEVSAPGQQIPGTIGDFQCRTFEDAKKFNCNFPPNACRCHTLETKANCVCASDQLQKLFNNGDQLLPLEIAGTTFEGWEKTVRAMYSTPSAIQLQMQIQNLKVTTMISNSKCTVAFNKLIGCYNCNTGAEVKATCKTDFGSPLAYVTCAGSTAAISCNPAGHTETLKFQFQESKIDINCKVKCPNTETESKLKGDLAFVGHDVHSSYHLIAADEINAASSLDFNFLFNWFSLQHHWLLLIAAFILIFVVIMIVVKNLPVFQAVNILSSMVKKEL
uniref:Phlebovirus glycoprotein G2 fusion domain-containing protein n=1 Tax=Panagrolaimus superbus TaxID=310955 RepID=A0A914Z3T8_9BILA